MSKWIAEFELEDGDTMPEHMDLNYMGAKIDFHCRPMWTPVSQKLPDKYGIYLVTLNNHDTDFCEFYPNDRTFGMNGNVCYEVTAWCELPQPYKGESENKE